MSILSAADRAFWEENGYVVVTESPQSPQISGHCRVDGRVILKGF